MASVINTNVASLNAQRNLTTSQSALATSLQRLSSGLRINSAKDDAAGLAITDRMTSQIRGLNQATRNANDGISLAQTAESGLAEVGNNLQRIRELAVQSANATNTSSDRASLNAEVTQLMAEIQRVANTSQFNGQNILDGTFTSAQFQVGANANQTITASTGNAQTTAIGSYQVDSNSISAVSGSALTAGQLTLNGIDVGSSTSGSAEAIAASINSVTTSTGVTASAKTTVTSTTGNPVQRNQALQSGDLVINGVSIGAVAGSSNVATQGANIAAAINAVQGQTGVTATANGGTGALTLTSNTGRTIDITTNAATTADGATRVENATGLELAGAGKVFGANSITIANGARQVVTHTSTATATTADTLSVAGVTFTYSAAANSATNIQISGVAATQGANVRAALALNSTVTNAFTITGATTDAILTAKSNVASTAATDGLAKATATANAGSWASTTAGAGVSIGDTLKIGGLIYEFTAHNATAASTAGNIMVRLGTGGAAATNDDDLTATNLASAISAQQAAGNGTVGFTSRTGGAVTVTNTLYGSTGVVADPTEPTSTGTAGAVVVASVTTGVSGAYAASSTKGTLALNSPTTFSIGGTAPTTAGLGAANVSLNTISKVDISTVDGANNAISLIDGALSQIATIRGNMGALQNRFGSVVSSLTASSENLSAARSRIQDADFAAETAQLTRNQILQQAGTAMLAQANSLPQSVLSLLK